MSVAIILAKDSEKVCKKTRSEEVWNQEDGSQSKKKNAPVVMKIRLCPENWETDANRVIPEAWA